MSAPIPKEKYYPSLDGLRGLAILLVICYHYLGFIPFFRFGWMGTDLFFVLSGFLITGRLAPYLSNKKLLPVFYRNRFLRIVPVYFSFLLLFFGVWIILSPAGDNHFFSQNGWTFFLFIQNWFMITDPTGSENHLQHLWSLAVEEQFYLFYPFLLLLFYRYKYFMAGLITVMIMLIGARHLYVVAHPSGLDYRTIYWNSFFRFDAFLTGALLYQLQNVFGGQYKKLIHFLGIAAICWLAAGIIIYQSSDLDSLFFAVSGRSSVSLAFAYLTWLCIQSAYRFPGKLFETKWLAFTGKISYSLFIFHWPILLFGFAAINKINSTAGIKLDGNTIRWITIIISLIISFAASYFSFRYYETWFLHWKKKMNG